VKQQNTAQQRFSAFHFGALHLKFSFLKNGGATNFLNLYKLLSVVE
jgi:hypothetical protein